MGCGQSKIHLYPRKSKSKANGKKGGHVDTDDADEEEGHMGEEGGEKDINRDKDHRINDDTSPSDEKESPDANGEISVSLIRAKNLSLLQSQEISSSQQNFFRMLDQKIEEGPDYDSNSETEIALEEARLNTLVQHWESASLTASLCSSASRSLQTTPVRQVAVRQQPQLPLRATINSLATLQQPLSADLLPHHNNTSIATQPGLVISQHQLMQQQHQQQQQLQQQQMMQQQGNHMIMGMGMIPVSGSPQQAQLLGKSVNISPKRGVNVNDPRGIVMQSQVTNIHQPYGVVSGQQLQQQQQMIPQMQQQQLQQQQLQQQQLQQQQLQQQQMQQQMLMAGGAGVGRPIRPTTPQMVGVGPGVIPYYGQPQPQSYFTEVLHPMQVPQAPPEYRFPPAISVQRLAPQVQRQLRETQELIKDSCPQLYAAGYGSPGPPLRNQPRNSRRPPTLETQYSTELS